MNRSRIGYPRSSVRDSSFVRPACIRAPDMRDSVLRRQLPYAIFETDLSDLGERYQGKVRDTYARGDRLILVTTDRISAFDHVLRQSIPFKGQVLNQLAAYFFEATSGVARNHLISVPDPNVALAVRCEPVPVELDRKSTRLNSSHVAISYAVFCLKKKKTD